MLHKTFDIVETKADGESGTFEALVSVFGNVDQGGDRVMPGAFANTLESWRKSGDPIPVILSHQWNDPMAHIGVADPMSVFETERGLWVKGTLDVNDNEVAAQVYRLMRRRSLREFSFGYGVAKGGQKRAKDGANELTDLDLVEVGPTLKGLNPSTELHAVKSALEDLTVGQRVEALEVAIAELRDAKSGGERRQVDDLQVELATGGVEAEPAPDPLVGLLDGLVKRVEGVAGHVDFLLAFAGAKELTEDVKGALSEQESQILDAQRRKADATARGLEARPVDPLRKRGDEVALEVTSGGASSRKPPRVEEPAAPDLELSLRELRTATRDQVVEILSGIKEP